MYRSKSVAYTPVPTAKRFSMYVGADFYKILPEYKFMLVCDDLQNQAKCPACKQVLISVDRNKRRCMTCHFYLADYNESTQEVVVQRMTQGVYASDIDGANSNAVVAIKSTSWYAYYETSAGLAVSFCPVKDYNLAFHTILSQAQ